MPGARRADLLPRGRAAGLVASPRSLLPLARGGRRCRLRRLRERNPARDKSSPAPAFRFSSSHDLNYTIACGTAPYRKRPLPLSGPWRTIFLLYRIGKLRIFMPPMSCRSCSQPASSARLRPLSTAGYGATCSRNAEAMKILDAANGGSVPVCGDLLRRCSVLYHFFGDALVDEIVPALAAAWLFL